MNYRPWGLLEWTLQLDTPKKWMLVGALGTEERSLATWNGLRRIGALANCSLLEIHDSPSHPPSHHSPLFEQRISERRATFLSGGGRQEQLVANLDLLDEFHKIDERARALAGTGQPIILDITSLPKRYFFPILRRLVSSPNIRDLIVTYTSPKCYLQGQPMSEEAGGWEHLPGFVSPSRDEGKELLIVGVGFMVESLQSHIGSINNHAAIKLLIPFPAPLKAVHRSWDSVYRLEGARQDTKFENYRVAAHDMCAAFDRIVSLARPPGPRPAFAPFGPKPISAAMCLYAMQENSGVYYPQPTIYHPDYSQGIGKVGQADATHAYWIKHNGSFLYSTKTGTGT